MDEIKLDHLSWSQINTYLTNPMDWYYKYVKYPHLKAQQKTFALDEGTEYHAAMEGLYKGQALQSVLDTFDMAMEEHGKRRYKQFEILTIRNAILYYYETIFPIYAPFVTPENVEIEVKDYYIRDVPVPIHMRIDLLTTDGRIIDHKTVGRYAPKAAKNGQGLLYSSWYYRTHEVLPRGFELHKAFKIVSDNKPVVAETASFSLPEVLNIESVVRGVYKMMMSQIWFRGLQAYPSEFDEEWDRELIQNG